MDFGFYKEMRRFYAPQNNFSGNTVMLDMDETRHLRDVLRLRVGEEIQVFDGTGNEFLCRISEIGKKDAKLEMISAVSPKSPESNLEIILGVAILKGEKFDLVVQKAVELGITKVIPVITKRCDAKSVRLERLQRIILEATKQCGRARLMELSDQIDLKEFIAVSKGARFLFSELGGGKLPERIEENRLSALIGPEGGWDDDEISFAAENGFEIITLEGRILRAETASISISAILQHRFGDLN